MTGSGFRNLLPVIGVFLLLVGAAIFITQNRYEAPSNGEVPTEITAAGSHDSIKSTGEVITRTVLGMLNENGLEITNEDLEQINLAINLLTESKAAFYVGDYTTAAGLAENSRALIEQLKNSLDITEANLGDVYVAPPTGEVSKYKGIWTHTIGAMRNALANMENLKRVGVNFVAVTLDIELDENGNVQIVGKDDCLFYILAFHRSGLRVLVMPDPCHPAFVRWGKYEWTIGENDVDVVRGIELMDNFIPKVLELAEMAENYGVEMYSPLNEPQTFARNLDEASQWIQQILPDIREKYNGKLVVRTHGSFPNEVDLDFSGYDYIASWGSCAWPEHLDYWRLDIRNQIDNLVAFVERDGCENGFIFDSGTPYLGGSWYEPLDLEQIADENIQSQAFQILFEEAWEKVNGFFPPTAVGWDFLGRPAENVVEMWYGESDTIPTKPIDKIWSNPDLLKLVEKVLSPEKRPFYLWSSTNRVTVDNQNSGPNGLTSVTECDEYAYSHEDEADAWLREQGIEGYGNNFFVEDYID